jgi:methionine-rich copper-binding protein CopC
VGLAVALATGSGVLLASPASAHSDLISSNPRDGATLSVPPTTVLFSFNENVRNPAYVVVNAPDGTRMDTGPARVLDNTVTEDVKPLTEAGRYTFAYRVVSADGHVVSRELSFTLTTGTSVAPSALRKAAASDAAQNANSGVAHGRELAIVGVLLLAGIVFLLRGKRRPRHTGTR